MRRGLARSFLADPLVEMADRRAQRAGNLEQPPGRNAIYPALVFVRLLIGDADHLGELLLREPQHDTALANARSDMVIDCGGRPPSLRLSHIFTRASLRQAPIVVYAALSIR